MYKDSEDMYGRIYGRICKHVLQCVFPCIQRHSCTKEVCVNLQLGGGVRAWVHMCMCTVHLSSNNASGPESAQLASSSIRAGGD